MDACINIFVVAIENEGISLASNYVQLLQCKQKRSISSSITLNLDCRHPSTLTPLDEHHSFFEQVHTLLDPTIHHHEFFSIITPDKPSIFGQSRRVLNQFNCIKVAYEQYNKNSAISVLADTFPCSK